MTILQTPETRFANLPGYPFAPNYVSVGDGAYPRQLRMHYVDEGPRDSTETVLMLHGEPTWSYLYRNMIPMVAGAGYRVIAPDLIGFGKSDKLLEQDAYSYQSHIDWLTMFIKTLDLQHITLVCQDWGGLLGLRLAAENSDRFVRITASNTGLPTGDQPPSEAFLQWQAFSQTIASLPIGSLIRMGCVTKLPADVIAAYDAPFPDETYKAASRIFPKLVPTSPDDPAAPANRAAWQVLMQWQKPFLTCFSDRDPITAGGDRVLQKLIPGAQGQSHVTLSPGGHFVQEDKGEEWAERVVRFIRENPVNIV
ncbi:haloalkane dehalogenase [Spirosoma montaniterrae]|uniref:Haloalkane dehalogenase n=1 Tax=Spirosoma montaniterrae TaxID=1178516 RepID=A0A1P9WYX7_9BACT|nr:haloalkane dehalogenase [Spirosoma montaniterrae]AQG80518.1 haloalkane dehalogenase [Spirosoma montaniterrae]